VAPPLQQRLMGRLAVGACAVLVLFALSPGLSRSLLILCASGFLTCFQLAANAAFVRAAPERQRSQAFGLAQGGMSLGQGAMMLVAGAAAERLAPATVIAICGAAGAVAAMVIAVTASARQAGGLTGAAGPLRSRRCRPRSVSPRCRCAYRHSFPYG